MVNLDWIMPAGTWDPLTNGSWWVTFSNRIMPLKTKATPVKIIRQLPDESRLETSGKDKSLAKFGRMIHKQAVAQWAITASRWDKQP